MSTYAIKADKFFLPAGPQLGGYLMVEDGVFGAWQADEPSCEIKDYTGSWIAPGMVDTHIHGFYNHSTTDNDPEGIDISSTELARRGTTSWLPTTFTDGVEQIKDACAAIAQADEGRGPDFCGARIQGIYLEGPFFTMKHVGAQNPAYLIDPSEEVFDQWQEAAGGRIVKSAMAAERDGAAAYAAALNAKGVVTSIGHSDATYDECIAAINAGASCFTHTYNGQRGLHHREPGVVGAAMSTPETYAEIICDGKHVNPAAIKALLQAKGWQHTVLGLRWHARGQLHQWWYGRHHEGQPVLARRRQEHCRLGAHACPGRQEHRRLGHRQRRYRHSHGNRGAGTLRAHRG